MRHRLLLALALLVCVAPLCHSQTTVVTAQAVDADAQAWAGGSLTASLYSPPGVPPGPYVITGTGTIVPNQQQSGTMNGTGIATLTVTPNTSISPSGTLWNFNFCPAATPAACTQFAASITGASQTVSPSLPAIRLSVNNPLVRVTAYLDLEIIGANLGNTYFNLTDSTIHVCTAFAAPNCTTWAVVGSGGGGSGITGLTTNVIPQAGSPTTIINTNPILDNNLTNAFALTYKGSGGFVLPSDGVHAGSVQLGGNTTLPAFANNSFGWLGPNSASFTSYFFQPPTTAPTNGQTITFGTPVGNVVPLTYTTPGGGGTITCGSTCTTGWMTEFTGGTSIGNSVFQDQGSQGTYGLVSDLNASQRQEFNTGYLVVGPGTYTGNNGFQSTNGLVSKTSIDWQNTNCAATNAWCYTSTFQGFMNGLPSSSTTNELSAINAYVVSGGATGAGTTLGTVSGIRAAASNGGSIITSIGNMYGIFATVGCGNSNPAAGVLCANNTDVQSVTNQAAGAFMAGTGNTTQSEAIYAALNFPTNTLSQTATNAYGLLIDSPLFGTNATATHLYGLLIKDQTLSGTGTNSDPHGLVTQGTAPSSFGGALTVSGQITATEPTGSVWGSATGGAKGAGTINATGLFVNGAAVGGGVTSWSGDSVLHNNAASTGAVTETLINQAAGNVLVGPRFGAAAVPSFVTQPSPLYFNDLRAWISWNDDFDCTVNATGGIGCHGWISQSGTAALDSIPTGTGNVYGAWKVTTGTVSGNTANLFSAIGNGSNSVFAYNTVTGDIFIRFACGSTTTIGCFVGLSDISNNSNGGETFNAIGVSYDTSLGDTHYMCVTKASGTATRTSLGNTADTAFHTLHIRFANGTIGCQIDGGTEVTQSTNVPSAKLTADVTVTTRTTAAEIMEIDYYMHHIALSR